MLDGWQNAYHVFAQTTKNQKPMSRTPIAFRPSSEIEESIRMIQKKGGMKASKIINLSLREFFKRHKSIKEVREAYDQFCRPQIVDAVLPVS